MSSLLGVAVLLYYVKLIVHISGIIILLRMLPSYCHLCLVPLVFWTLALILPVELADAERQEGPGFTIKPQDQQAKLGSSVTFQCEGSYGPGHPSTRSVEWFIWSNKTNLGPVFHYNTKYNNTRYKEHRYNKSNGETLGNNLTVENVMEEDYDIDFQCEISSAQMYNTRRTVTVRIRRYPPDKEKDLGKIIAPAVCGSLLVIAIICTVLVVYNWPRISFEYYLRCGPRSSRNSSFPIDLMVIHDYDDPTFVNYQIAPRLDQLGYSYKTLGQDVSAGQSVLEGTRMVMEDSQTVMFVITPEMLESAVFTHLFNMAHRLRRNILLVSADEQGREIFIWEQFKANQSENIALIDRAKSMKVLKWPGENPSNRQMKKFWYSVRKRLPVKQKNYNLHHELSPSIV